MKRFLLAAICLLALVLAGCTTVNQTNSFVVNPTPEAINIPAATLIPEVTATPEAMSAPEATQPPVVQLEIQPTPASGETEIPATVPPTSPPPAQDSPGGFNG